MSHWKYTVPGIVIFTQATGMLGTPPNVIQSSNAIVAPKAAPNAAVQAPVEGETEEQLIAQWSEAKNVEDSFFAVVIGSAEGTRSVDGGKTSLYEGHTDPGNGVHNRGSFSYQFGNEENLSPEESSRRQLGKILGHIKDPALQQARQAGITLTAWELMNLADIANQAPLCVTSPGGYIERLVEARKKGWDEYKTVLWARVESFWDSSKNAYDAGGLRAYDDMGKRESVLRDQDRRMHMMRQAMERKSYKIAGGSSYQAMSYKPAKLQEFFDQVKKAPGGRVFHGGRGGRVPPLEYTSRFQDAIGLVSNTRENF